MRRDTAGNIITELSVCPCCTQDTGGNHEWNCPYNPYRQKSFTRSMHCFFDGEKMCHTWTYAGDPNYFPCEGMKCDCGEASWHKSILVQETE